MIFFMFELGFYLGPPLQREWGPLQKFSKAPLQEPRRGVGNSFQPAIDASREALTNCVIAPSAKIEEICAEAPRYL